MAHAFYYKCPVDGCYRQQLTWVEYYQPSYSGIWRHVCEGCRNKGWRSEMQNGGVVVVKNIHTKQSKVVN